MVLLLPVLFALAAKLNPFHLFVLTLSAGSHIYDKLYGESDELKIKNDPKALQRRFKNDLKDLQTRLKRELPRDP